MLLISFLMPNMHQQKCKEISLHVQPYATMSLSAVQINYIEHILLSLVINCMVPVENSLCKISIGLTLSLNFTRFLITSRNPFCVIISVFPIRCADICRCYCLPDGRVNVLNCSRVPTSGNIVLKSLMIPNETTWLVADSNNIGHSCWKSNDDLPGVVHLDLHDSNIMSVCDDFLSKLAKANKITYLNLINNAIVHPSKIFQNMSSLQEVYLAGNPIDCNCDMIWFAKWVNYTTTCTGGRVVKDYQDIKCSGGEWDGKAVYKVDEKMMGCIPFPV